MRDDSSKVLSPLRVAIHCYGDETDSESYVESLRRAFLGMDPKDGYAAPDFEWIHPLDFLVFMDAHKKYDRKTHRPFSSFVEKMSDAEALFVILLFGDLKESQVTRDEVVDAWKCSLSDENASFIMAVSLSTGEWPTATGDKRVSKLGLNQLDERDLRKNFLDLFALRHANELLIQVADRKELKSKQQNVESPLSDKRRMKIFFSHAKRDGVPLARSLVAWMEEWSGSSRTGNESEYFYDSKHLDLSRDVPDQLEAAIKDDMIVVLRTEIYDARFWCQQEVLWAEKHGAPILAVDARWNVQHGPAVIGVDSCPSVRIPDGSMLRILLAAFKEALRVYIFKARVAIAAKKAEVRYTPVPRYPTLFSLVEAQKKLQSLVTEPSAKPMFIVYPNPAMPLLLADGAGLVASSLGRYPVKDEKGQEIKMEDLKLKLCSLDQFRMYCGFGTAKDPGLWAKLNEQRPFAGLQIGISISKSDRARELGIDHEAIKGFVVDLARRIIALGGTVVLGHQWRPNGIMDAVAKFAMAYRGSSGDDKRTVIINCLAHPSEPELSTAELDFLGQNKFMVVNKVGRPKEGDQECGSKWKLGSKPVFWKDKTEIPFKDSRKGDVFYMRQVMAAKCDARIVVGGSFKEKDSYHSGLLEETWMTLTPDIFQGVVGNERRPTWPPLVLCSSALGGVAQHINCLVTGHGKVESEASETNKKPRSEVAGSNSHRYLDDLKDRLMKLKQDKVFRDVDTLSPSALISTLAEMFDYKRTEKTN